MTKPQYTQTENRAKQESRQALSVLKTEWHKHFKTPPPFKSSREFLGRNISWQKQAKEQCINLPKFYRIMNSALVQYSLGRRVKTDFVVKSGTKFIRQWQGVAHEIEATGPDFIYNGESYKSLSAIARKITGTQWNGKLFFGVKK